MFTIMKLFAESPFAPLQSHMDCIAACVHKLPELFSALRKGNQESLNEIVKQISKLEHKADLTKNDIRNHLPRGLFLPIDRAHLLEILTLQDSIADKSEDIAVLTTFKPLEILSEFDEIFQKFLDYNIDTFDKVRLIINELQDLLESSFGGKEAEKVRDMVDQVAYQEHEVDLLQRELMKSLIYAEDQMSYTTFFLWQRIIEALAEISNLSEKLAWRVRRTLELK
ncbi:MAG: TIGR00153 family protein [Chlamydiota bacterium]|nr:TIGR00153 family protein [Chlamydiota bacterium]